MLYKILEAHEFVLPPYIEVIFANTGKEMPQTLDFIRDVAKNWGSYDYLARVHREKSNSSRLITTLLAGMVSLFAQLIEDKNYLPNMMARFCTSELKVLTIERYMGGDDFLTVVGIRGDEPRRALPNAI